METTKPSTGIEPKLGEAPLLSRYRWVICGLLFFATTINYMDRQVISYLKAFFSTPVAQGGFGWTNSEYSNLTSAFTGFYAGMTILAGWVIDKIGTKMGLAISLIVWSLLGIANAFVGKALAAHIMIRSAFGIGEAGNFPASIKTIAEWFPKRERALATGIFNSGTNCGAMIAALFVPWCLGYFGNEKGWKMAFIITGSAGFLWLFFWFWLYDTPDKQKRLSKAEYDYIHSDKDEVKTEVKSGSSSLGKLFSFSGRVPGEGFLGTTVMVSLLSLFVFIFTKMVVGGDVLSNTPTKVFFGVWSAVVLAIGLALHAKRWHDLGRTGWLAPLSMVPIVGYVVSLYHLGWSNQISWGLLANCIIVLAILGFWKGSLGSNAFGNTGSSGVLGYRQTWSFFWGKFLTDGVWWFYLFWLPDYLNKQFGMTGSQVMLPTFIVYGVAIVGSVYGGSLPMTLINKGMPVYKARMTAMFLIALCPLLVLSTQYFGNVERFGNMASVLAIAVICVGAAAHQAWSANMFTTVSDMFPKRAVGSVTGIGAMAGGLGGVIVQKVAGGLTDHFKDTPKTAYLIMFIICSVSYLVAWGIMKILVPRHKPITDL